MLFIHLILSNFISKFKLVIVQDSFNLLWPIIVGKASFWSIICVRVDYKSQILITFVYTDKYMLTRMKGFTLNNALHWPNFIPLFCTCTMLLFMLICFCRYLNCQGSYIFKERKSRFLALILLSQFRFLLCHYLPRDKYPRDLISLDGCNVDYLNKGNVIHARNMNFSSNHRMYMHVHVPKYVLIIQTLFRWSNIVWWPSLWICVNYKQRYC